MSPALRIVHMGRMQLQCAYILFGCAIIRLLLLSLPASNIPVDPELYSFSDAESTFARGELFDIKRAGIYELELITGISDRSARAIVARKNTLCTNSGSLDKQLQAIPGIGPKTAKKLTTYFRCKPGG